MSHPHRTFVSDRRFLVFCAAGVLGAGTALTFAPPAAAEPATAVALSRGSERDPLLRTRLRHLYGTAAVGDPGVERLPVPRRRCVHRGHQPHLRPARN